MSCGRVSSGFWAVLLVWAVSLGCRPTASDQPDIQVDLSLNPSPPVVGEADVTLKLSDGSGVPLEAVEVQVEGNMNHAGMKPSFADLQAVEPGSYSGRLDFTMAGDWFILVTAKLPDGTVVERKIDVPGVKAP